MQRKHHKSSRIRYKQIPIEKNLTVNEMFDFKNNKLHVKCNFEGVRRLYDQHIQTQKKLYEVVNHMSVNQSLIKSSNVKLKNDEDKADRFSGHIGQTRGQKSRTFKDNSFNQFNIPKP